MSNFKQCSVESNLSHPYEESPHLSHNSEDFQAKDRDFSVRVVSPLEPLRLENFVDPLRSNYNQIKSGSYQRVLPKRGDVILQEVGTEKEIPGSPHNHNYAEWRKLTLVAKTIKRFRTLTVERIGNEVKLKSSMASMSPSKRMTQSNGPLTITHGNIQNSALVGIRDQSHFYEALERGNPEDLKLIRTMLANDPKKHMYDADSNQIRVNQPNPRGYTPLYVACKNGNLEVLKLLLNNKANPYQAITLQPRGTDTIIEVAARWGHLNIIRHLIEIGLEWPANVLKNAFREAGNTEVKNILKTEMNKNKKPFLSRLFSSPKKSIPIK